MTTLADRTIAALRTNHDDLADLVPGLSTDQLDSPSAADEWPIAQVLSHLGSGAEISLAGLRAALAGADAPGQDFNSGVWDRWNAMSPQAQADGFLEHNATLVQAYEALTPDLRETLRVKLGFLPAPLSVAGVAGMRLTEACQHAWDVHAALDPAAPLDDDAAEIVLTHLSGELAILIGFLGKAGQLATPAVVDLCGFGLEIADRASLSPAAQDATATFAGPPGAALRLLGGRLKPQFTPVDVTVTGNVTLDELRAVFSGY